MFGIVEDKDIGRRSLGSYDEWILRHVAGTVDLSVVVYLDVNLYLPTH